MANNPDLKHYTQAATELFEALNTFHGYIAAHAEILTTYLSGQERTNFFNIFDKTGKVLDRWTEKEPNYENTH